MPWDNLREEIEAEFAELSAPDPALLHKYLARRASKLAEYRQEYDSRPHAKARRDAYWKRYYAAHRKELIAKQARRPRKRSKKRYPQTARARKRAAAAIAAGREPGKAGRPRKAGKLENT